MKPGPNSKRSRGRGNPRKPNNPRNQTFESAGPEVRVRGTVNQVLEKYLALARDASSSGDYIAAENYFQHAEHYFRILNANGGGFQGQGPQGAHPQGSHQQGPHPQGSHQQGPQRFRGQPGHQQPRGNGEPVRPNAGQGGVAPAVTTPHGPNGGASPAPVAGEVGVEDVSDAGPVDPNDVSDI
ncbi:MAG: DUF4167 domain-containing protein [Alphaproteobacteria bacterium]